MVSPEDLSPQAALTLRFKEALLGLEDLQRGLKRDVAENWVKATWSQSDKAGGV